MIDMTEENQEQKIAEEIVEEREPKSDKTPIMVARTTAERLTRLKNFGETYEDVILRLLDAAVTDGRQRDIQ